MGINEAERQAAAHIGDALEDMGRATRYLSLARECLGLAQNDGAHNEVLAAENAINHRGERLAHLMDVLLKMNVEGG